VKFGWATKNRNGCYAGFTLLAGEAPFPDKDQESRAWLSERNRTVVYMRTMLARCAYFSHIEGHALAAWFEIAQRPVVGLIPYELSDFAPAFEHEQTAAARTLLN